MKDSFRRLPLDTGLDSGTHLVFSLPTTVTHELPFNGLDSIDPQSDDCSSQPFRLIVRASSQRFAYSPVPFADIKEFFVAQGRLEDKEPSPKSSEEFDEPSSVAARGEQWSQEKIVGSSGRRENEEGSMLWKSTRLA